MIAAVAFGAIASLADDDVSVKISGEFHRAEIRAHVGIPSVAVSPVNGRMWVTWYNGKHRGEDLYNYVSLVTSADGGKSWKEVLVADPDEAGPKRSFDPELWIAPDGKLRWTWTERLCDPEKGDPAKDYGLDIGDPKTDIVKMATLSAEDEPTLPLETVEVGRGVMMCKPIALKNGEWLFPLAHWTEAPSACFYASKDSGKTFKYRGGATIPEKCRLYDEHQAVEKANGEVVVYIRGNWGKEVSHPWQAVSKDGGKTWSESEHATFDHTSSRIFVTKLKSGNWLLIKHGAIDKNIGRRELMVFISKDEGKTWQGGLMLDERENISYPDGQELPDGRIIVVYDRNRLSDKEIHFAEFTEADALAAKDVSGKVRLRNLITRNNRLAAGSINIDNGRQLFVDDYLIESTNGVVRYWNTPTKHESPIIRPTNDDGSRIGGCTVATDGGLWWDPTIGKFRLWYEDNWAGNMRYAESQDGLKWEYPDLGKVKGTNRVFSDDEEKLNRDLDSWSVWPNYKAENPYVDWRMFVTSPWTSKAQPRMTLFASADGRDFRSLGVLGWTGDRTTMHYDTMLGKWVYSMRDGHRKAEVGNYERSRSLAMTDDPTPGESYLVVRGNKAVDNLKPVAEPELWTELDFDFGPREQLYNFDAVPYESLMLGVMEVLHNTPRDNHDSEAKGLPKQTALRFAFSRDGRTYFHAPEEAIKPCGWGSGKWDTGYLSAMGGICVIKDERLWFYYSALRGDAEMRREVVGAQPMYKQGMYYNGAIGAATLRRDGFCGMVADGNGEIVTKPVAFTGGHLFVNAECLYGEVAAELIDETGAAIPGYSFADCRGLKYVDCTKAELVFGGGLGQTAMPMVWTDHRAVRIRFKLHCATLYSFWVSPSERGESRGYVAAGGPAYNGLKDL